MKTIISRFKNIALFNICLVMLLSCVILTGWQFYSSGIKDIFPDNQLSNPVTAITFLVAAVSLACIINVEKKIRLTGQWLATAVLIIGLIKFSEVFFGYSTGIDKWLFSKKLILNSNQDKPNFMAPNTAMSFVILGISLLLFRYKINKKNVLADYFASAAGLISLACIIGFAYEATEFYHAKKYIPMAFPTAVSFLLLSLAILFWRSEFGFFSLFTTRYEGSKTARFLIPFAILIPVTTGLLRLFGERIGLYSSGLGVALFAITNIILFVFVIWRTVLSINTSSKALAAEIEERQKIQEELKQNNFFLDTILENIPDMIFVKEARHLRFVQFNKAGENLIGLSKKEILGKNDHEIFPGEKADYFTQIDREVLSNGGIVDIKEEVLPTQNGDRWIRTKKIPINDDNGSPLYLLGISEDITAQIKAEAALKEYHERFLRLFYASPLAMVIRSVEDGKIIDVNEEYERLLGYKKEDLVGQTSVGMGMILDKDFSNQVRRNASDKKSVKNIEATLHNAKEEPVNVLVSIETMRLGNTDCILSALLDITERKKAEEQLKDLNKELESFSYSVSHDLRAPLRIINGYAELIISENNGSLNDDTKRMLGNIMMNSRRMGQLIDDLLNFSRLGRREIVSHTTNIDELVRTVLDEQSEDITAKYKIKINDLPPCVCDSSLVKQVWQNLISNAVKYAAKNPSPVIEIGSVKEENKLIYYIKDNGVGFDMKYYDKLFGVFQRLHTASDYEGTGVGLALVNRIIKKHGGEIRAESKINEGTTFYFTVGK
jgi:PAS domain S-box-containing protein